MVLDSYVNGVGLHECQNYELFCAHCNLPALHPKQPIGSVAFSYMQEGTRCSWGQLPQQQPSHCYTLTLRLVTFIPDITIIPTTNIPVLQLIRLVRGPSGLLHVPALLRSRPPLPITDVRYLDGTL